MCGKKSEEHVAAEWSEMKGLRMGSYAWMMNIRFRFRARKWQQQSTPVCIFLLARSFICFTLYYISLRTSMVATFHQHIRHVCKSPSAMFREEGETFSVIIVVPIAWDIGLNLNNKLVDNQRIHITTTFLGLFSPFASILYYYFLFQQLIIKELVHSGQGLWIFPHFSSTWPSRDKFVRYTITIVINIKMTLLRCIHRLHIHRLPLLCNENSAKIWNTKTRLFFFLFRNNYSCRCFFCGRFFRSNSRTILILFDNTSPVTWQRLCLVSNFLHWLRSATTQKKWNPLRIIKFLLRQALLQQTL